MPIIPIEPAKAVSSVLAFLVFRLLNLRDKAVKKDIARIKTVIKARESVQ